MHVCMEGVNKTPCTMHGSNPKAHTHRGEPEQPHPLHPLLILTHYVHPAVQILNLKCDHGKGEWYISITQQYSACSSTGPYQGDLCVSPKMMSHLTP